MPKFIVPRDDRTFVDLQGVTIHHYAWLPPVPKAIVLIVHGVGEHALRYEHVAQTLVQHGYGVYALDQRGHGATGVQQSGGRMDRMGRLGAGGLRAVLGDMVTLLKRIHGDHDPLPVGIIGHSWGSLMTQKLINRHADLVDAVVLSATAYRMPGSMNAGDLNKRHRHLGATGFEWLSRDPEVAAAFVDDPLTFGEPLAVKFGYREASTLFGIPARRIRPDVPVLITGGSDDSLGGPASYRRLADAYQRRSGLTDVTVTVYPGARHEIFNEINKVRVIDDTIAWLDARLMASGELPAA